MSLLPVAMRDPTVYSPLGPPIRKAGESISADALLRAIDIDHFCTHNFGDADEGCAQEAHGEITEPGDYPVPWGDRFAEGDRETFPWGSYTKTPSPELTAAIAKTQDALMRHMFGEIDAAAQAPANATASGLSLLMQAQTRQEKHWGDLHRANTQRMVEEIRESTCFTGWRGS